MPGAPTIRPAAPADAARLALLSAELGYPVAEETMLRRLEAALRAPDEAVLVAGNPATAFIHLRLVSSLTFPLETEIEALVVAEAERGRGIGSALLAAAVSFARERGCARVRVRSQVFRDRAHAFYEREGFSRVKTQHVFVLAL